MSRFPEEPTAVVELTGRELAEIVRLVETARRVTQPATGQAALLDAIRIRCRSARATLPPGTR